MLITISEELERRLREIARTVVRTPFTRQAWSELWYLIVGTALAVVGFAFVVVTMALGLILAITFFGLAIMGLSLRGARGIGGLHRSLGRSLLHEHIDDPEPFVARPGFLGWLQSALRDRTGWRSVAYVLVKVPLAFVGIFAAFSLWYDAFVCLIYPFDDSGDAQPHVFGLVNVFSGHSLLSATGWFHALAVFCAGVLLLLAAPWAVRLVVHIDRLLQRAWLGPDATDLRMRSLEHARAQTVDASAATLRRIERDLHDGTQAQLVALAMRLGMAKEKLAVADADPDQLDLDQVRQLVDDAHRGAKEAIVELRDLARGIHPPALDIGLEGALTTLAARSTVPADLTVALHDRPTPAIEAIAYFCVAELLANVAQHAQAARANIVCAQQGQWLRLVVRDDGVGGARIASVGRSASGLLGLTDRVRAVDGRIDIQSPAGGPTVVTVDLPLHA